MQSLKTPKRTGYSITSFFQERRGTPAYALARLMATNLTDFADAIAMEARAGNKRFFAELAKALSSNARQLWDSVDERIVRELSKISKMTEEKAAAHLGLSATALDTRLQRLGVKRPRGRKKSDK